MLTRGPNRVKQERYMLDRRVICIVKPNRNSPVERIQELQGITIQTGDGWWATPAVAAQDIINETDRFFTEVNGHRTYLDWRQGENGKYVQTYANKEWNDNLLSLPECRVRYGAQ